MADPPDIFARRRLTVGQLRAVADRRYGDAEALVATGDNARANGAQYLAGIVVEILLKGQLLAAYPQVLTFKVEGLAAADRPVWSLVWRSHDLEAMLDLLPSVRSYVDRAGRRAGMPCFAWLLGIATTWTIFARYSPATSKMIEVRQMVDRVRILKELLR